MDDAASSHQPDPSHPPTHDDRHAMPAWVKRFVAAAVIVGVLLIAAVVLTDSNHGPGRHGAGAQPSEVESAGGHAPPPGMDH